MRNNKLLYSLACVFVLSSSVVYGANECQSISGDIQTQFLLNGDQFGTITIHSEGKKNIETCGIYGYVTNTVNGMPSELTHDIICKGHSTLTTTDIVVEFLPDYTTGNEIYPFCEADVVELSNIDDGTGKFSGASGDTTTKGTINLCSGQNNFEYTGELCISEDQQ